MKKWILANSMNYILLTRPKFQVPSVTSMFVGLLFSLYSGSAQVPGVLPIIAAILITGPFVAGGALILNQVFDYEYDKTSSKKLLPIASGSVNIKIGTFLSLLLFFLGSLTSFLLGPQAGVVTMIVIALSIAYSTPPFRFKARPGIDSISNGLCYGVFPTLVGWVIASPGSFKAVTMAFPLFLFFTANHILLAIPDICDDRVSGILTTAVILGRRNAVRTAMFLWLSTTFTTALYVAIGLFPYQTVAVILVMISALIEIFRSSVSSFSETLDRLKVLSLAVGSVFICAFLIALSS